MIGIRVSRELLKNTGRTKKRLLFRVSIGRETELGTRLEIGHSPVTRQPNIEFEQWPEKPFTVTPYKGYRG